MKIKNLITQNKFLWVSFNSLLFIKCDWNHRSSSSSDTQFRHPRSNPWHSITTKKKKKRSLNDSHELDSLLDLNAYSITFVPLHIHDGTCKLSLCTRAHTCTYILYIYIKRKKKIHYYEQNFTIYTIHSSRLIKIHYSTSHLLTYADFSIANY